MSAGPQAALRSVNSYRVMPLLVMSSLIISVPSVLLAEPAAKLFTTESVEAAQATPPTQETQSSVKLDFASVQYFPNLKSKIGIVSNLEKDSVLKAEEYMQDLGPGLICSVLEFDHWFSFPGQTVPALLEKFKTDGDASTRPVATIDQPSPWMVDYSKRIGDADIPQLVQLVGAPAQYQVASEARPALHQPPTDLAAAADFMSSWTDSSKHPYPILWSLWNEPGHTISGVKPGQDESGAQVFPNESRADYLQRAANGRQIAADAFAAMYSAYNNAIRPRMGEYSKFGFASLLSTDFLPIGRTADGRNFFQAIMGDLTLQDPSTLIDFLSFNSYNGIYAVQILGSRALLAGSESTEPLIFTQYAPRSMNINVADESIELGASNKSTPLQIALYMLDDLSNIMRATDVRAMCLSYWLGAKFSFMSAGDAKIVPQVRYQVLKMFMDLPVLRTTIDFGSTQLQQAGLRGLAGVNANRAAVLFWNEGASDLNVPISTVNLPRGTSLDTGYLRVMSGQDLMPRTTLFDGRSITVPSQGVAMLSFDAADGQDPLERRKALGSARFLSANSIVRRVKAKCTTEIHVPGIPTCGATNGNFGFYDSVRSVAYLGKGIGGALPVLDVTYDNMPSEIYVTGTVIGHGEISVKATYSRCHFSIVARFVGVAGKIDASKVPSDCRTGPVTLKLVLWRAEMGAQAEIYLNSDAQAAANLGESDLHLQLSSDISIEDGLKLPSSLN